MSELVLLIEEDDAERRSVEGVLREIGYDVEGEAHGSRGICAYEQRGADVVVLDLSLSDMSGMEVLRQLKSRGASVVLLSEHGDVPTTVHALRSGAEDFLTKPVDPEQLAVAVTRTLSAAKLRHELDRLKTELHASVSLEALGVSARMQDVARNIERLADADRGTILLTGESGTGKGWVARLIHQLSPRSRGPFISVTCGGLADSSDDELFGHGRQRRSLFEMATGGTLFLDEIGDLHPQLQTQLLSALEARRIGSGDGGSTIGDGVRLVAATNRDLDTLVGEGAFRKDLLYRIGIATVRIPPLRERSREDCADLARRLFIELGRELAGAPAELHADALEQLVEHSWPGNVRELRNVLEWSMIMGRGSRFVRVEHLPHEVRKSRDNRRYSRHTLAEMERQHVERVLGHHAGNRTRAARDLGISRATLIQKIKRYGL